MDHERTATVAFATTTTLVDERENGFLRKIESLRIFSPGNEGTMNP